MADMADKLEIYRNYGVLNREKVHTYTYGGPSPSAVASDKITVSIPEGWKSEKMNLKKHCSLHRGDRIT